MPIKILDALIDPIAPVSFTQLGYRLRSKLLPWEIEKQTDLRIAITGPTSGLGKQLAIELDSIGGSLVLIARNESKLDSLLDEMTNSAEHAAIVCDLTDPESIRSACGELRDLDKLDVLVHNAGTIFDSFKAIEGTEQTLFSHVVAPFALSQAVHEQLTTSDAGRIIYVASGGLYTQAVKLEDLRGTTNEDSFNGARAYAKAKRIQTIIASAAAKELADPIQLTAHPGWVDTPGLEKLLPGFYKLVKPVLRTPTEGIDTIRWLCTTEADDLESGSFYFDRRPRPTGYIPGTKTSLEESTKIYEIVKARAEKLINE